jgi:hypothetical protein
MHKNIIKEAISLFIFVIGIELGIINLWSGIILEKGFIYTMLGEISILTGLISFMIYLEYLN